MNHNDYKDWSANDTNIVLLTTFLQEKDIYILRYILCESVVLILLCEGKGNGHN